VDNPLISTFGRLVEAYNRLERSLGTELEKEAGVPHAWFEVLVRLGRSEGEQLSMGELARQIALTTGGVTRLVDRMQTAGLVERRPCPTDRRVAYAALTDDGRDALARAATVHARNLGAVFADFDATELTTLDDLLDRLRDSASRLA
jgi:DNA-binding MarR family transcriptional regulator